MGKIVIVGSGPAGCSAALYAARAGQEVVVISMGMGALSKAELIQNYYGFEEGITGAELYRQGVAGAKAVGAEFITAEVVGLDYTGSLVVQTTEGDYPADAVILATGAGRITPKIAGLAEHEGRGVSYCATCDAFFYRGKTAAVLGSGEYALHEVQALLPLAGRVILCTNGEPLTADFPEGVEICTEKLAAVEGEEKVSALRLENGELLPVEGLFVALGVAGSAALARKLGAPVENGRIVVDERMQTGIPGLYAAGDCTGGARRWPPAPGGPPGRSRSCGGRPPAPPRIRKEENDGRERYVAGSGAAFGPVRGADIHPGKGGHRRGKLQSGNGHPHRGGAAHGVGNGLSDQCAGRHSRHQHQKLAVFDPLRTGHRGILAVLL